MDLNPKIWQGKRVLVTGHTGFKGSWLTLLLKDLGAEVVGISLVTNAAAGMTGEKLNHEEVMAAGKAAADRMGTLLSKLIHKL